MMLDISLRKNLSQADVFAISFHKIFCLFFTIDSFPSLSWLVGLECCNLSFKALMCQNFCLKLSEPSP